MKESIKKDTELIIYLKKQIEEYQQICAGLKEVIAHNKNKIEIIQDQIMELRQKEDTGFYLFSPIAVKSEYKDSIDSLLVEREELANQSDKHAHDLVFYESKIEQMTQQLDECLEHQVKAEENEEKRKQIMSEVLKPEKKKDFLGNIAEKAKGNGHYISRMFGDNAKEQIIEVVEDNDKKSEIDMENLMERLKTVKKYLYVDARRCDMEINKILDEFIK